MSEKSSGFFLNLVKKAVGMPTGSASCCAPAAQATEPAIQSSCCTPAPLQESPAAPAAESSSSCCSTTTAPATENRCCG